MKKLKNYINVKNFKKFQKFQNFKKYQKSEIFSENHFFSKKLKYLKIFFSVEEIKNAILLVLIFKEISIQPKLNSPPCFRILGGSPECYTAAGAGQDPFFLILDKNNNYNWFITGDGNNICIK